MTVERRSSLTWLFESIVSSKELYLQSAERAMILNCFRVNCIIKKLYSSCYWFSDVFSLHDFLEIWSFVRVYRALIASRYWHEKLLKTSRYRWLLESVALSNELHLQNFWTRHDINDLLESIVSSRSLHLSCRLRYVFAVWLDRDLLYDLFVCSWSMIISCQCQCLIS